MRKLDNKGNISIILSLAIVVIFGFMAYVIDIGIVYGERIKLSNAIDAAVLAAAMELPTDSNKALEVAKEYLQLNNVDISEAEIIIGEENKSIQINGGREVEHFLAVILGVNESKVNATTNAIIGPVKSVAGGIRPFVVELNDYSYGDLITLKEGSGDGYHGNYGAVALGGTGANIFKNNSIYGYDRTLSIGDEIDTETGNMAGVVNDIKLYINSDPYSYSNFERNTIRLWTIPMVDTLEVDGRDKVTVVGFAQFFVENIEKKSGKAEIEGRFIRYVTNGEIDMSQADTGTYGVKLIK